MEKEGVGDGSRARMLKAKGMWWEGKKVMCRGMLFVKGKLKVIPVSLLLLLHQQHVVTIFLTS